MGFHQQLEEHAEAENGLTSLHLDDFFYFLFADNRKWVKKKNVPSLLISDYGLLPDKFAKFSTNQLNPFATIFCN